MRRSHLSLVSLIAVLALGACNRHESGVTSSYGQRAVSGQVVMAGGVANSNPAGVEVSVLGTGMTLTLVDDGRFAFFGVPENAELMFYRADGINARLAASSASKMTIELSAAGAKASARRRGVGQKDPGPARQYEGLVLEIASDSMKMLDSHRNEVTMALTESTLIRKGNQTLSPADINVGDRIHAKAVTKDNVLTALQVIVQKQENDDDDEDNGGSTMTANGLVKSVGASSLVVQSRPKGDVTVNVDANTIIKMQGQRISISDIKEGWEVNTQGTRVDEHTLLARQIEVRGKSKKN